MIEDLKNKNADILKTATTNKKNCLAK